MGLLCVQSWWMCVPNFVLLCASRRRGITIGGATEPAGHDHAQWQHRSIQGYSLYLPEIFGWAGKSYEEVMRTWCRRILMAGTAHGRQWRTTGGATEPAAHAHAHWRGIIKFFTRCQVHSKFGEFWGMFGLPKQQLKCRRIILSLSITIGTLQVRDLLWP